jgi:hypothetical protein
MRFKTIYQACADLMYGDGIPYIIWITKEEKFGFKPTKVKIFVHGNGTFEILKKY